MICTKCGSEVPDRQLVCDCFQIEMTKEMMERAVEMFERGFPLILTRGAKHLISRRSRMTFCQEKSFKTNPGGIDFSRSALNEPETLTKICQKCLQALRGLMKQSA